MRKIVLLITCILYSLFSFSQKLNCDGYKMVSSVVIYDYGVFGDTTRINVSYGYDSNKNLKSVRVISEDEDINVVKDGNKLISDLYVYALDEYGRIVLKEIKYDIGNDLVKKWTRYFYEGDVLSYISRQQFVKRCGKWYPSHDIYYLNFGYFNDDCYWEKSHSSNFNVSGEREYYDNKVRFCDGKYGDIINDMNINPNLFLSMLCWEICLDVHEFELSTEWCGMRSEHILENENGFHIETIKDKNGNICEMLTRYTNGNVFRKISINYVR